MPRGGSSHDRRRKRRAAERDGAEGMSKALHSAPQAVLDDEVTASAEMTDEELFSAVQGIVNAGATSLSAEREALARVAAFADDVGSGTCDNCDHSASAHQGDDNMGACSMEGCDCDGFQPASEGSSDESADTESDKESATVTLGIDFSDEAIDLAAAVLVKNASLVDVSDAKSTTSRVMDRVKFRLENLAVDTEAEAEIPEAPESDTAPGLRWTADAVFEGVLTDDGRAFAPGSLGWRQLPLTLGAMLDTPHAEVVTESRAAGSITSIVRNGSVLVAEGVFDSGEFGQEVARMVGDGTLRGISVDVAVAASEVAPKLDYFDEEGRWRAERIETSNPDADLLDVLFGDEEPPIYVVTEGTIGAITICPFPAFADARIAVAASLVSAASPAVWTRTGQHGMVIVGEPVPAYEEPGPPPTVVTASAVGLAPVHPPAAWFDDPCLRELTALTITDLGMVYGHAAPWDTCHIAIPDVCTTAPHSETDYQFFHLKEIECDDGSRVVCGTITLDTGHAARGLSAQPAVAHYDDTGTAAADVVVGEDEFGIWVAGALRPDVDAEQARKLQGRGALRRLAQGRVRRRHRQSGARALLAVNVPGFPVPRTRAMVAAADDGTLEVVTLTAAGIHAGTRGRLAGEDQGARQSRHVQGAGREGARMKTRTKFAGLKSKEGVVRDSVLTPVYDLEIFGEEDELLAETVRLAREPLVLKTRSRA